MSRMATPTMDVVRFREGDVIVASSHRSALWEGLGTGIVGDAHLHLQNGVPVDATIAQIHGELTNDNTSLFYPGMTFKNGDNEITLQALVNGNDADGLYTEWNGLYFAENGAWQMQKQ